ncbi:ferritin-like domain-containing protein [Hymenobacter sp. IS2118]|uniref:ferritin-like domain-containing protein n=1 Tax=Hymenobacter sp. IS2118 TaxID=1505605 RepID=UPI00054EAD4A|nr:ferritin-like domain-containing protein [Hymenobacter sp. IS2118]
MGFNPGPRLLQSAPRRSFLKFTGLGLAGVALASAGCHIQKETPSGRLDIGEHDLAVLNYAYALEQLEGAFYEKVVAGFYGGASALEKDLLTDIRNDEIAHREWFSDVLVLKKVPRLQFDFSSINFADRKSVLTTARTFEDLGVSAYNGAGQLLALSPFLNHAGKIVSVEARHAATIRNLLNFGSFADSDVIDANGLDGARTPAQVMALADKYFVTKISVADLPTH